MRDVLLETYFRISHAIVFIVDVKRDELYRSVRLPESSFSRSLLSGWRVFYHPWLLLLSSLRWIFIALELPQCFPHLSASIDPILLYPLYFFFVVKKVILHFLSGLLDFLQ